jgi:hypothetical protein
VELTQKDAFIQRDQESIFFADIKDLKTRLNSEKTYRNIKKPNTPSFFIHVTTSHKKAGLKRTSNTFFLRIFSDSSNQSFFKMCPRNQHFFIF